MSNEADYETLRESTIAVIKTFERTVGHSDDALTLRSEKRGRRSGGRLDIRVTTLLLGFASEVVTNTGTVLEILDKRRPLEAIPLIRAAYEAAVTARWVEVLKVDAALAVVNEYVRKQRTLQDTLSTVNSSVLRDAAPDIADAEREQMPSLSNAQARSFKALTDDFLAGPDIYAYYRMMSAFSHPGVSSLDQYFQPPAEEGGSPLFTYQPRQPDRSLWAYFSTMSLCIAVRPLAKLMPDKDLFRTIDRRSQIHNFPVDLQRSSAWQKRRKDARGTK